MIPRSGLEENLGLKKDFEFQSLPSLTYRLDKEKKRFSGECDKLEAIKQAVYKILFTERYKYAIYSWNYGVELENLIGRQMTYVSSEAPVRIKDALMQEDRITDVIDFNVERAINEATGLKNALHITFTVVSTEGSFEAERTVNY